MVLGILLLKIRSFPLNVSSTSSVITLQRLVLSSHMVSKIPDTSNLELTQFLIFFTVKRRSFSPVIAQNCVSATIITSSAADSALMFKVFNDGHVSNAELNIMQSNYLKSLIKPMIFFLFTQHNIPYRIPLTNHRKGVPIWSNTR